MLSRIATASYSILPLAIRAVPTSLNNIRPLTSNSNPVFSKIADAASAYRFDCTHGDVWEKPTNLDAATKEKLARNTADCIYEPNAHDYFDEIKMQENQPHPSGDSCISILEISDQPNLSSSK